MIRIRYQYDTPFRGAHACRTAKRCAALRPAGRHADGKPRSRSAWRSPYVCVWEGGNQQIASRTLEAALGLLCAERVGLGEGKRDQEHPRRRRPCIHLGAGTTAYSSLSLQWAGKARQAGKNCSVEGIRRRGEPGSPCCILVVDWRLKCSMSNASDKGQRDCAKLFRMCCKACLRVSASVLAG